MPRRVVVRNVSSSFIFMGLAVQVADAGRGSDKRPKPPGIKCVQAGEEEGKRRIERSCLFRTPSWTYSIHDAVSSSTKG